MRWCSQGGAEPFCAPGDHHGSSTEAQPCPCAQPPAHPSLPPAGAEVPAGLHAGNVWPVFPPVKAARPLPALQVLPACVCVCVCAEGTGPWVLVAELVHCLMHPSPSAGARIGITCPYGGCIIVVLLPRPLASCACHERWGGSVFPVHFLPLSKCYLYLLTSVLFLCYVFRPPVHHLAYWVFSFLVCSLYFPRHEALAWLAGVPVLALIVEAAWSATSMDEITQDLLKPGQVCFSETAGIPELPVP